MNEEKSGLLMSLMLIDIGKKSSSLRQLPLVKLQAVYKFLEQLYVGGVHCIIAVKNVPGPPRRIMDMINDFSIVPEWIKELKMSACRKGAMSALALAKAYHPEMDSTLLADEFPEFNADNTLFTKADVTHCVRETRPAGTTIAHRLDLTKFQVGFDEDGERMNMPQPKPFELIPSRKQAFASEAGSSSNVLIEDMKFEALSSMQWVPESPQTDAGQAATEKAQENPDEPVCSNPLPSETEGNLAEGNPANQTAESQPAATPET